VGEVLPLAMQLHSALQHSVSQVRLEHLKVEAHYSDCLMSLLVAFAYLTHSVTRLR